MRITKSGSSEAKKSLDSGLAGEIELSVCMEDKFGEGLVVETANDDQDRVADDEDLRPFLGEREHLRIIKLVFALIKNLKN